MIVSDEGYVELGAEAEAKRQADKQRADQQNDQPVPKSGGIFDLSPPPRPYFDRDPFPKDKEAWGREAERRIEVIEGAYRAMKTLRSR